MEKQDNNNEPDSKPIKWWLPLYEYMVHILVGTAIFILVAVPAVGVNFLAGYLSDLGVNNIIIHGLTAFEYLIFGVDVVLFIIFNITTSYKYIKKSMGAISNASK